MSVQIPAEVLSRLSPEDGEALAVAVNEAEGKRSEVAALKAALLTMNQQHTVLCQQRNQVSLAWAVPGVTTEQRDATHAAYMDLTAQIEQLRSDMEANRSATAAIGPQILAAEAEAKRLCRLAAGGGS